MNYAEASNDFWHRELDALCCHTMHYVCSDDHWGMYCAGGEL